jgi:hypothetical protein
MKNDNQLTIRFGGDGNIRVETLTDFLEQYKQVLYLINQELGYSPDDMVVEVSPPENGSFKIKLKSKYKDLILDKMGDITAATLTGLIILFATNTSQNSTKEEVEKILKERNITNLDVPNIVYNVYQNTGANQKIQQTFVIVNKDENIKNLKIENDQQEFIDIPRNEFTKLIENNIEKEKEEKPLSDTINDEAILIIKTLHFEGNAKWGFIFRGYPIKASIKDLEFIERLKSESFSKGDSLKVILSRERNYDEDLQTYIINQSSYKVQKVIEHNSKKENRNQKKLNLK